MTSAKVHKGDPNLLENTALSREAITYIESNQGKSLNFKDLPGELKTIGSAVKALLTAHDKQYLEGLTNKFYMDDVVFEDPVAKIVNSSDLVKYLYYTTAFPYKGRHVAEHAVRLAKSKPYKSKYKYPDLTQDVVMEIDMYTRYELPKTNTPLDWTYPPYIPYYLTATLNIDPKTGKILKEQHNWLNIPFAVPGALRWLIGTTAVTAMKLGEGLLGSPR